MCTSCRLNAIILKDYFLMLQEMLVQVEKLEDKEILDLKDKRDKKGRGCLE